ncbi:MAG: hypothetical protein HN742_15405 [Lentisphaerae bacterium]|jgi:hypothetical protein|nr:hypothetical protein [Lentisphaerota bacterium]MBT4821466.1 hypothetical protein [Lentisphaerota bacterium]MBT5604374.1 hypothetical protein [Lentisphaerota bacterium]MBT7055225.1 hypothetical protein [Lentisphaerota bacterium]MBT7843264.1 hypothetical protein [Lentisphaerota bacterium]
MSGFGKTTTTDPVNRTRAVARDVLGPRITSTGGPFSYVPRAIEHEDYLLITFSRNKKSVEVIKVPLSAVEALFESAP